MLTSHQLENSDEPELMVVLGSTSELFTSSQPLATRPEVPVVVVVVRSGPELPVQRSSVTSASLVYQPSAICVRFTADENCSSAISLVPP